MYELNTEIKSLYCIKCGAEYPVGDYFRGCPQCLEKGENVSLSFRYRGGYNSTTGKGMQRYEDLLPYRDFPTLGEGNTPVIRLHKLAQYAGVKEVYVKNEFQNPTGSHKDRMSALVAARALAMGKETIVAASSGNAGISLAVYAAYCGLDCKIISPRKTNPAYRAAIEATGAELIVLDEQADTVQGRWRYMGKMVEDSDWYPATNYSIPPVGSCSFGVQGYKTIAYEIFDEFGKSLPGYIVIPVSRGDLLWGIYEGFMELQEFGYINDMPKLICVEPFERVSKVLAGEDYRKNFHGDYSLTGSIGGNTVTYQAYAAVKGSRGFAVAVPQSKVVEDIRQMARLGLYLEASSAVIYSALIEAAGRRISDKHSTFLLIATSGGFKNSLEILCKHDTADIFAF